MITEKPVLLDFTKENKSSVLEELNSLCSRNQYLIPVRNFCKEWLENKNQFVFVTSGSTGKPKEHLTDRKAIISSVEATSAFFDLKPGDNLFVCLNTLYTGGKMMLARALHIGLRVFIVPPSNFPFHEADPQFYQLAALVPSQLFSLFGSPLISQINQFRNIIVGGAPVHPYLKLKCQKITECEIYETFGMTETLSHIALKKISGNYQNQPFKTLPGVEIDSDENDCLRVKASVTKNTWIITKDVVEITESGLFYWRGRYDNVINSGGIKIFPEEIENTVFKVLQAHGIKNFFITGQPDEKFSERLVLVAEGQDNHHPVLDILKSILPDNHAPSGIVYQKELKRTLSGKIMRII